MTFEQECEYMRLTLAMAGYEKQDIEIQMIVSLYRLGRETKGKCDVGDIMDAVRSVNDKHGVETNMEFEVIAVPID